MITKALLGYSLIIIAVTVLLFIATISWSNDSNTMQIGGMEMASMIFHIRCRTYSLQRKLSYADTKQRIQKRYFYCHNVRFRYIICNVVCNKYLSFVDSKADVTFSEQYNIRKFF